VLELRSLSKRFGEVVALDDASLKALRGRVLGFLGPNGAGKTTAMRAVFGLVSLDGGEALWEGSPVEQKTRLRFGYMPEQRGLYPKMKLADQLTWLGRIHGLSAGAAAASAAAWLGELGLAERSGDRLEQLSHGNQQRVQLAAAMVHEPDLLVLDEPFSGLDPMGADHLGSIIRKRANAGVAVLFSSHQLDLVQDVCDDVAIIDRGHVVLSGSLQTVRESAAHRRLDVSFSGEVEWHPQLADSQELGRHNGTATFLVPVGADPAGLLADASKAGRITRFSFQPPTLSDLFREAVQR
jgi:ABC-2 type transport system ATP-binding protein